MEEHPGWTDVVLDAWRAGQRLSAIGPGEVEAHLAHAEALAALLPPTARSGLDLGTGAGLPGLALAGLRPDLGWVLLDAARRRLEPVHDAVRLLGWEDRVQVVHARAEEYAQEAREGSDVVVARSFGPPPVVAECASPLVAVGGTVIVTEPPGGDVRRWPPDPLAALGLEVGAVVSDASSFQVLHKTGPAPADIPRRPGRAAKRPRW